MYLLQTFPPLSKVKTEKPKHPERNGNKKWNHQPVKSVSLDVIFKFVESSPIKKCEKDNLRKSINMKVEKEPFKKPTIKENLKDRVHPMIRCFNRFDLLKVDETDNEENYGNDEEMEYINTNKPKSKKRKK